MKIGILTFHRAINYGAIFQAYALLTFLKKKGHEVEIIDYWPQYHIDEYKMFHSGQFQKRSLLGKCRYITEFVLKYPRTKKRNQGCLDFIYKEFNLSQSPKYLTGESIEKEYDVVFYGSDQIWRKSRSIKENMGFDEVYFAKFPLKANKKVSYAASMGVIDLTDQERLKVKCLLANFDSMSVREDNLFDLVNELGYEAELTLDPVFLLEKKAWEKIIPHDYKRKKSNYILFYHHTPSDDATKLVSRLSKEMKCDVVEINSKVLPYNIGLRYNNTASPGEFIALMRDAEFVVSTSFHGTVFSVLLNKQFFALGMGKNAERSKTLLKKVDLIDRYIESVDNIGEYSSINYKSMNEHLDRLRVVSRNFLKNHFS